MKRKMVSVILCAAMLGSLAMGATTVCAEDKITIGSVLSLIHISEPTRP